jgi:hypothetical protein
MIRRTFLQSLASLFMGSGLLKSLRDRRVASHPTPQPEPTSICHDCGLPESEHWVTKVDLADPEIFGVDAFFEGPPKVLRFLVVMDEPDRTRLNCQFAQTRAATDRAKERVGARPGRRTP